MAWQSFTSLDGMYSAQWDVIGRMIRSFVRSDALANGFAKPHTESHVFGPDIVTVEVDWDKVRQRTDEEGERLLVDFYTKAQRNTQPQIARLKNWVEQTRHNNALFHKKMQKAQKQTMDNIEKSVGRSQDVIEGLRVVRDFSAAFLMVSATVVTGGGAAAAVGGTTLSGGALTGVSVGALATGAGLKATAKAEDDPKASKKAIAATFVAEFGVGLLDLGAAKGMESVAKTAGEHALERAIGGETAKKLAGEAAEKGTHLALAILWNQVKGSMLEPGKAIVEGKTIGEAMVAGGLSTAGGNHAAVLKYLRLSEAEFPKAAAVAETTISFGLDKLGESLMDKNKEKNGHADIRQTAKKLRPHKPDHAPLDALTYASHMIERTAIRKVGSAGSPFGNNANNYCSSVPASMGFRR